MYAAALTITMPFFVPQSAGMADRLASPTQIRMSAIRLRGLASVEESRTVAQAMLRIAAELEDEAAKLERAAVPFDIKAANQN